MTASKDQFDEPDLLKGVLSVTARIQIPHEEFTFQFARSSGPGGQNDNKVNSKATLRWRPLESPSLPDDVRQRFAIRFASKLLKRIGNSSANAPLHLTP